MEYETAGDPITGLKWTRRTTEKVAKEDTEHMKVVVFPSHGQLNDSVQIAQIGVACDFQAAPDHGTDPTQDYFQLVDLHAIQFGTDWFACGVLTVVPPTFLCSPRAPLRPQTLHTALALAYGAGLRLGELVRLTVGNLDFKAHTLAPSGLMAILYIYECTGPSKYARCVCLRYPRQAG